MKIKLILLSLSVFVLTGCTHSDHKEADGKVLCDPEDGSAYIVEHRLLAVSAVKPLPSGDKICEH